ncbi:MAG: acyl-CoA dehydrogenase [Gammaproteobacteria bacterium]|nr:MAG: acyl-CoA dehydrogenase [Gammaproteobacteria bacterium]
MTMTAEKIEQEVNAWLDEHWDPSLSLEAWRTLLVDGGWATPAWPGEYFGRDFTIEQAAVVARVFREREIVPVAQTGPRRLAAETILAMGNDDQKRRHLRPILTGEHSWCQLFSEPGSGSDLAGLSTKAERKDGKWIINGQKVWNTSAHHADFGILVARTDFDLPKHQGISYFLIDMHQPGVEVRPLKQMNGHASFNEVFMTDAVVAEEDLVGGEGNGWAVAKTTLSYERRLGGVTRTFGGVQSERKGRVYDEYAKELKIANEPYTWYPQRQGRVDLVLSRARETGAISDPTVRQEIAKLMSMYKGAAFASAAAEAKRKTGSNELVPAGSIGKLAASKIARQAAHVHTLISGADAMRSGPDSAAEGMIAEVLISVPAISIAGGTDEIQRNIISERVLDMPKEARSDTGPFRDIKRND